LNTRSAYRTEAPGSDEPDVTHFPGMQPQHPPPRIRNGVIRHHRTTTSELPFT